MQEKESISLCRRQTKWRLWRSLGPERTCVVCGKIMGSGDAADLHEGIFHRSEWNSLTIEARDRYLIFGIENCVLVHHTCHMASGQSSDLRKKVIAKKVSLYGADHMREWLNRLNLTDSRRTEAERMIEDVRNTARLR